MRPKPPGARRNCIPESRTRNSSVLKGLVVIEDTTAIAQILDPSA